MRPWQSFSVATLIVLIILSLLLGADSFRPWELWGGAARHYQLVLFESRVPRTFALILAGASLGVAGLLMQMIVRNRFAEPSTTGTMEGAVLGFVLAAIFFPGLGMAGKTLVSAACAAACAVVYLVILNRIPLRSTYLAPLIGLIFGGIIHSISTAIALDHNLTQSLYAWTAGDFASVIRGRYELLWLAVPLVLLVYHLANQFTVSGFGRDFSTGLGLNHNMLTAIGLAIVSAISALVVIVAGGIAFIGLIIPNLVRLKCGDNVKVTLPWIAVWSSSFLLLCDVLGRVLIYPHEIPVGTVIGVFGSILLLVMLKVRKLNVG